LGPQRTFSYQVLTMTLEKHIHNPKDKVNNSHKYSIIKQDQWHIERIKIKINQAWEHPHWTCPCRSMDKQIDQLINIKQKIKNLIIIWQGKVHFKVLATISKHIMEIMCFMRINKNKHCSNKNMVTRVLQGIQVYCKRISICLSVLLESVF